MSGLPGQMALAVAKLVHQSDDFELLPFALTGPEMDSSFEVEGNKIELLGPEQREVFVSKIKERPQTIVVDYSHPLAVQSNVDLYTKNKIPFVIGTTGGDYQEVEEMVVSRKVPAIVAPNMALPIVALTAMLTWAKDRFPGVFDGYDLFVKESHQKGKVDTSGTAKALMALMQGMGAGFTEDQLSMCRDPKEQKERYQIPDEHLRGHAFHTYDIFNQDRTAHISFGHNVLGRKIYAEGTLLAVKFLVSRLEHDVVRSYHMIDVLENLKDS